MRLFQEYLIPNTIEEAVSKISSAPGSSAVIAGGTDLLLDIRQGRHDPVDRLVDVSEIQEMREIAEEGEYITIGAAVTHKQIITSPLLQEHARCLVEGCGLIGGPQVRNVATIGGNVSHALPAGDGTIALLALGSEVEIASLDGTRWQPLIELFAGPGKVTFNRDQELVVRFRFAKKRDREASAFHRVMRPQRVAIAILNLAAWVKLAADKRLEAVRIACGPAGPTPFRAFKTEAYLTGKTWDETTFQKAAEILAQEVSLRTSAYRATKEYRHKLLPQLLKIVLDAAVERSTA